MLQYPVQETRTPSHSTSDSSTSISPVLAPRPNSGVVKSKPRRRQTKAACMACRRRKSKCDGGRPSCKICTDKAISCQYSVEEGVTQQQATKEQLKSYKYVLALLRNSSSRDCDAIIHILKSMEDLNDACRFILDAPVLLPGK
ncbi:hypothetical protein D6C95_00574 [Aureobasidium pullulans]|nr:hypothetical protein D6C95_00574 [Aureobasidium pullulans]